MTIELLLMAIFPNQELAPAIHAAPFSSTTP
jgi:hypothetical protein